MSLRYLLLFLFTALLLSSCKKKLKTFTLLDSDDTGITFSNRIAENDTMNILSFEYVYNGGGVALGDFNNDSLPDIYFTGNSVDNKLYLNKGPGSSGSLQFEDVTNKAGVAAKNKWSSGVALIDINNDGLLDIYVCSTVRKVAKERENLLYVNQGIGKDKIPVFKEWEGNMALQIQPIQPMQLFWIMIMMVTSIFFWSSMKWMTTIFRISFMKR